MPTLRERLDEEITKKNYYKNLTLEMSKQEVELKRKASEDLKAKDDMLLLLRPPKFAKNEYLEQKPAKYVFKCMDGDIQIPEYGLLRTDFYYQTWITKMRYVYGP